MFDILHIIDIIRQTMYNSRHTMKDLQHATYDIRLTVYILVRHTMYNTRHTTYDVRQAMSSI